MPPAMIAVYAEMRPRLEAERWLEMVDAMTVASGHLKPADARKLIGAAQRRADGGTRRRRPGEYRPRTAEDWAAIPGVRVQRIPRKRS